MGETMDSRDNSDSDMDTLKSSEARGAVPKVRKPIVATRKQAKPTERQSVMDKKEKKTETDLDSDIIEESDSNEKPGPKNRDILTVEEAYNNILKFVETDLDPTKRLRKDNIEALKNRLTNWALIQAGLIGENTQLRKENEKLKRALETRKETVFAQGSTYAAVAKTAKVEKKIDVIDKVMKTQRNTIFITSKKGEDAKKVQEIFRRTVDPVREKLKIKRTRTTGKVMIVETENEAEANKILNNDKLKENLNCEPPKKRKPLMIVYNVPADLTERKVKQLVYEQNFEGIIRKEEYEDNFNMKFKTGPRDKTTVHHVVEISAKLRKILLNQKRIYVAYGSYDVKDYIVVPRCMKCQDLGHVSKYCRKENQVCSHCGDEAHKRADCPRRILTAICIPCKYRGKRCVGECATNKMLVERLIAKTDYEVNG